MYFFTIFALRGRLGMAAEKHYIAVDCGSSNGKMVDIAYDGNRIRIADSKPFSYEPVTILGCMYNDIMHIYNQVMYRFKEFVQENGKGSVESIGVTTWGGDYGLFGENGQLLSNMFQHRDERTLYTKKDFFALLPHKELYYGTGSVFFLGIGPSQLFADERFSPVYDKAKFLLGTANVLTYFLSGRPAMDDTMASSLGFANLEATAYNIEILEKLGLRTDIFPELKAAGTMMGKVAPGVGDYIGDKNVAVVLDTGHDTPAALPAISGLDEKTLFISMGTMMLVGVETEKPNVNDKLFDGAFRTVKCAFGKYTTYRDVQGFWIMNQCVRGFRDRGYQYTFDELEAMARKLPAARCAINPNDPMFYHRSSDMMTRVQSYCRETGQYVPERPEEVYRCLIDSYALAARNCIEELQEAMGIRIERIKLFNGGCQCDLLGETISACTGYPLESGVRYATAAGNALVQIHTAGEVAAESEMKELSARSFVMKDLTTNGENFWQEAYAKYMAVWEGHIQE